MAWVEVFAKQVEAELAITNFIPVLYLSTPLPHPSVSQALVHTTEGASLFSAPSRSAQRAQKLPGYSSAQVRLHRHSAAVCEPLVSGRCYPVHEQCRIMHRMTLSPKYNSKDSLSEKGSNLRVVRVGTVPGSCAVPGYEKEKRCRMTPRMETLVR